MTEAASGSLKPPPTRRPRRIYLHLSHSIAPPDAFLTQSPRRTGRADFPHPALQNRSPQACAGHSCLAFWPSFCLSCESFPGVSFPLRHSSVVGISVKRLSLPLTPHLFCKAPSLHGRYPLLRYYEPLRFPAESTRGYCFPRAVGFRTHSAGPPRFLC